MSERRQVIACLLRAFGGIAPKRFLMVAPRSEQVVEISVRERENSQQCMLKRTAPFKIIS